MKVSNTFNSALAVVSASGDLLAYYRPCKYESDEQAEIETSDFPPNTDFFLCQDDYNEKKTHLYDATTLKFMGQIPWDADKLLWGEIKSLL
jgi:hypothetical protein